MMSCAISGGIQQREPSRPKRLVVLVLSAVLALVSMGAGPPVLTGSRPGSLPLYARQIDAYQAGQRAPVLSAPSATLVDVDTGNVLLSINPDLSRPMASTTKIMTALLALERADLADRVVVPASALIGEASMGLFAGEILTVEDLLWGLLLNSGNDAAMVLAEHVAGSEEAFVVLMNERAASLGMFNTRFANPHGLDEPGHFSSAEDLWRMTQAALRYPKFREIVATQFHTVAGHSLWSRNEMLGNVEGADGVKTGTTDLAGQCLVGSVTGPGGHQAVSVVLGSGDRYADAQALFSHYDRFYRWAPLPQIQGQAAWQRGADDRPYRLVATETPELFLPDWQWDRVRAQAVIDGNEPAGQQSAGAVRWYLGAQLLAEAPAIWSAY
ncbi:MAG: D-alanyl-D-alanine carboxypeptidase family protein [Chloroflexota bacterium]|nr:D-alanyl-D-alanine carboxypeptidase family protein [Chloroflexota bacterium]